MPTPIYGSNGRDYLYDSFDVDNIIYGYDGNDTIFAQGGDDWIIGGRGADYIDGGWGFDTVDYSGSEIFGVSVRLSNGPILGEAWEYYKVGSEIDTLWNIDQVVGSGGNDGIGGNDDFNILWGMGGSDFILGGGGTDWLFGGDDDDYLGGGAGADYLDGGAGINLARYDWDGATTGVIASLTEGGLGGYAAGDVYVRIQNLAGTGYDDDLRGDGEHNTIYGLAGNDIIDGGAGVDELLGNWDDDTYIVDNSGDLVYERIGEGHDTVRTSATYVLRAEQEIEVLETTNQMGNAALDLIGNEFGNTIIGNEGNNTIAGSPVDDGAGYDGLDMMIGNGGADRFVWTSLAESGTAASEADVVQDFTPGEDRIVISPIDADPGDADNDAFSFVGVVDFTRSEFTAPGQVGYFTTATDTYILLNTDGDRFEEMTIRVYGVHTVDATWFEL